jgi:acetyl esterase/lipase
MAFPTIIPRVAPSGSLHYDGIVFAELPGFRPLLLDLHVPAAQAGVVPPTVIYLHGGGFNSGDRRYLPENIVQGSLFDALTAAGIACATVDYRLLGEAKMPAQIDDTIAAIDFLQARGAEYGIDASRLGTWGESAGARLAAIAGLTDPRVSAVVGWYTPTDMWDEAPDGEEDPFDLILFGAPRSEVPEAAHRSSMFPHITSSAPPFLLVHGEADAQVPAVHSERLHELLVAAGTRSTYRPVPGADHCFIGYGDVAGLIDEAVAFFGAEL